MYYFVYFILFIFVTNACEQQNCSEPNLPRTKRCNDLTKFCPQLTTREPTLTGNDLSDHKLCPEDIFEQHVDNKSIPYQGWKVYVSATLDSMESIRKLIEPTLTQLNISYKVIKSREAYKQFNLTEEEQGKYFTIYPRDQDEASKIAHILNLVLTTLTTDQFMRIPYGMPLGKSGGLFTRYGRFKHGFPMKDGHILVVSKEDQFLNSPDFRELGQIIIKYDKQFQIDDRKVVFPEFIEMNWLPFGNLSNIFQENENTLLK